MFASWYKIQVTLHIHVTKLQSNYAKACATCTALSNIIAQKGSRLTKAPFAGRSIHLKISLETSKN